MSPTQTEPPATLTVMAAAAAPTMRDSREQARRLVETDLGVETLQTNFAKFLASLEQVFLNIGEGRVGAFLLEEITFSAEISADGEFKLLGTGVGLTTTSGFTFTLRRQPSREQQA
jgi:hypothetical protein